MEVPDERESNLDSLGSFDRSHWLSHLAQYSNWVAIHLSHQQTTIRSLIISTLLLRQSTAVLKQVSRARECSTFPPDPGMDS